MTERQKDYWIRQAMSALTGMPQGNIGARGPSLKEMDARHENGAPDGDGTNTWEDDACYDAAQYAWRCLQEALKEKAKRSGK